MKCGREKKVQEKGLNQISTPSLANVDCEAMMLKLTIDELPNGALFGKGTTLYNVILTDLKTKIIVRAILNLIPVRWSFKQ